MFIKNIVDSVINMIDAEIQFDNIWELKGIRFDIDPDQQKKTFEKYLAISYNVQDSKGNPGNRGHFFLTNLRVLWNMSSDHYINLSIGLDSILNVSIRKIPIAGGTSLKYLMMLKTQNTNNQKYQFRFMGFSEREYLIFQKVKAITEQISDTRFYRSPDMSINCDPQFPLLKLEQIKTQYPNNFLYQDNRKIPCTFVLTNIRLIFLKENQNKMNYGFPWITIKSIQMDQIIGKKVIRFRCRGNLAKKQFRILTEKASDLKKLEFQLKSFLQIYNKNPILGYDFKKQQQQNSVQQESQGIQQLQETKVNLVQRKNVYDAPTKLGRLDEIIYNQQIGLMMQKFPEGVERKSLWQIVSK